MFNFFYLNIPYEISYVKSSMMNFFSGMGVISLVR